MEGEKALHIKVFVCKANIEIFGTLPTPRAGPFTLGVNLG